MDTYGTGSLLSLDAVGKQDTYLTSNISCDSAFNYKNIRHSNFSVVNRVYTAENPGPNSINWPFNNEITFTMIPTGMGDLLSNMYFKCDLPVGTYTDQIGRALIDTVSFRVDNLVIETLENDWGIIHDEIFLTTEEKDANKYKVNGGADYGNGPPLASSLSVYVPLNFFFSRTYASSDKSTPDTRFKPYFPLCSILKQKIQLTIKFNPITFFTTAATLSLDSFQIINEEITISSEERFFLQNVKQELVTEIVKRNSVQQFSFSPTTLSTKCFLFPNIPVKAIFWFFRNVVYEDKTSNAYYLQRYNYSDSLTTDTVANNQQFYPLLSDAKLYLNSNPMLGIIQNEAQTSIHSSKYFKHVQTMQHDLSSPIRNIYTFAFALKPKQATPSGVLDFSALDSSKSFFDISLFRTATSSSSQFNVYAFFLGYQMLMFENGSVSLKYATF